MRLSTKMVLVTLGLVIVPLILLIASLFLLSVYRPRTLRVSYGQEDTNIMNINMIRRFDGLMSRLENLMNRKTPEELLLPETVSAMSDDLNDDKAYLLAYTDECYFNGGTGNQDVLGYVGSPETFEERDKLYFAGLSHPYLIGCVRFDIPAGGYGSLYLVCDASGSLPSVTQIVFLISISVLALVGGSIIMLSWQRIKVAKPFKQLEEAAQSIKEGNLDFELVPESDDEFGSLTLVFEEMRQRLKNSAEEQLRYEQDSKVLIGNISHDLKTPITAIKGYVEGIRDGVASSPEKQARYLATIYNKADELDRLVDQLAFYSLVDTNQIPYHFIKMSAGEYFDDCCSELADELEAQGMLLAAENLLKNDVTVVADPEQLHRAVGNVVSNSVKYRDPAKVQGEIRLKALEKDGEFIIEIEDNGTGIDPADLPHIFDRFYRSDRARSASTGGNGIGLSIVKKIMEDHGGRVWVSSRPGEGTRMSLALPVYEEKNDEQDPDRGR